MNNTLIAAETTCVAHSKFSVEKSFLIDVPITEKRYSDVVNPRKPLQLLGFPRFEVLLHSNTGDGAKNCQCAIDVSNITVCYLLLDNFWLSLML
jgi:hypothetical protein